MLLEEPVKSGDTGKSCLDSNLGNGEVSVGQKFFSGFDASVTKVVSKSEISILLKQSGEMIFTKTDRFGNGLKI